MSRPLHTKIHRCRCSLPGTYQMLVCVTACTNRKGLSARKQTVNMCVICSTICDVVIVVVVVSVFLEVPVSMFVNRRCYFRVRDYAQHTTCMWMNALKVHVECRRRLRCLELMCHST